MQDNFWSRRSFLKAAIVGTMLFMGNPGLASQAGNNEEKEPREGRLILYNAKTQEKLDVTYRDPCGEYDPEALAALNNFMRCHKTGEVTEMDLDVIEYLNSLDKKLGGNNMVHVVSAYRSKEYNDRLRRRNRRVARDSFHIYGKAIDFNIPGVGLRKVRKAALSLQAGGVGYYPRGNFIHIDSGRFRWW